MQADRIDAAIEVLGGLVSQAGGEGDEALDAVKDALALMSESSESSVATRYMYVESPHDKVADEEIVIYHIAQRERTAPRDRLTPRMEARRLLDALDQSRTARHV